MLERGPSGRIENRPEYFFDSNDNIVRAYDQVSGLVQDAFDSTTASEGGEYKSIVTSGKILRERHISHEKLGIAADDYTFYSTVTDIYISHEQRRQGLLKEICVIEVCYRVAPEFLEQMPVNGPAVGIIPQELLYDHYYFECYVGGKILAQIKQVNMTDSAEESGWHQMVPYDFDDLLRQLHIGVAAQDAR